ncbi:hypothetical protein KT99_01127 [Shewanella benthica KT99]|uniref:Uncharacterized protein n=1 Tax=Shewanella benthica KT99 TaxID=314608 RepID=A9EIN8_9GAMM|nr:hypothetical protein KT99_01127 [Shewanella benthica KT99]
MVDILGIGPLINMAAANKTKIEEVNTQV